MDSNEIAQYDPATGRKAITRPTTGGYEVYFGTMSGDEFLHSHAKPSKFYKTEARAEVAMVVWVWVCGAGR